MQNKNQDLEPTDDRDAGLDSRINSPESTNTESNKTSEVESTGNTTVDQRPVLDTLTATGNDDVRIVLGQTRVQINRDALIDNQKDQI
ncbi:MAG: hypothetical protein JST19_17645 [Bacteroidetes bacterium]|nr:hypothetical protein [Bacteroidota bacterium]